jgi:hypothetical protein
MTALSLIAREREGELPEVTAPRRRINLNLGLWLTVWAVVLVAISYHRSAEGASRSGYYALFWLGFLPPMLYLAARLLWPRLGPWRLTETLILAVLTWFPKFLRNPYGALYHDEYAHVAAVNDIGTSGGLYTRNPLISIIGQYPGLHVLTWALQQLTGLSVWSAGELLTGVTHLVGVVAVFVIGRTLFGSERAGGVMAFVYFANPNALYFDNQFAYESVGIVLLLGCIALTILATAATGRATRALLTVTACLTAAGCIMTHHLSTLFLFVLVSLITATVLVAGRANVAPWVAVWCSTVLFSALWLSSAARATVSYLSPYAWPAIQQLFHSAAGSGKSRQLFTGSVSPTYERIASYIVPLILAGLTAYAALTYWRVKAQWRQYPVHVGLAIFGLLYFPAAVFTFSARGAEGAHRSWGFSYLGIALITAAVVCHPSRPALHRANPAFRLPPRVAGAARKTGMLLVVMTIVVGNVAAGLNDAYRFPGPYQYGSETRSMTPELISLAKEFRSHEGRAKVVTDRFTSLALALYGDAFTASPSASFPAWNLLTSAKNPSRELAFQLTNSNYHYLIIDSRMATLLPLVGIYFQRNEPFYGSSSVPFPAAALDRLNTVPWASKVMQTDHYSVYRLHLEVLPSP